MRFIVVVNRTNQNLRGTWNGRQVDIEPGKHQFTEQEAEAYKRQNPVMGSENPMTGEIIWKLAIEEQGDDTSPLDVGVEAIERWDRTKLPGARPTEVVPGDNGMYSLRQVQPDAIPLGVAFAKD